MKKSKIKTLFVFTVCFCLVISFMKINASSNIENSLFGKVIYIDAGHGGKDNGASVDNVLEDEINLKISEYLLETLMLHGAYVLVSRTNDYDLASFYDSNRKRNDLNKRVKYINKSKPDIFVSIHLNTYSSESVEGAQVFYQNNDKSKSLANFIQDELNVFSFKKRNVKFGDYFILNNTNETGVLIECGFLSNNEERRKLSTNEHQINLANKIKVGIIKYFDSFNI